MSSAIKTIRWGIIGCGNVTEVKSGPGFQRAEGSELLAVMRRSPGLAEEYAQRHNVPRWYEDADALINDPDVDAVYIATPPGSHLDYALRVCAAGKPAYVEKPMARSYGECRQMLETFQSAGLPLFVAYYRRALPRFLQVQEILETRGIGEVTGVSYRYASMSHRHTDPQKLPWRVVVEESGGGHFLDLGCHTLNILDFLLGPLEEVSGQAANIAAPYAAEDSVAMQFRTSSGALGTAVWNFSASLREDIIEITGTNGRLSLSTFGNEPIVLTGGLPGDVTFDRPNPTHIQQPLIQTIVNNLRGLGDCPSTGESAARTSQLMDTVLSDYYGGRDDAFWTRPDTWPGSRG